MRELVHRCCSIQLNDLVRGHWWRAVRTIVPLTLLLTIMGPLLGLVLIFTPLPLLLINLIGSLVFALIIPLVATGNTLLYFDLRPAMSSPI